MGTPQSDPASPTAAAAIGTAPPIVQLVAHCVAIVSAYLYMAAIDAFAPVTLAPALCPFGVRMLDNGWLTGHSVGRGKFGRAQAVRQKERHPRILYWGLVGLNAGSVVTYWAGLSSVDQSSDAAAYLLISLFTSIVACAH